MTKILLVEDDSRIRKMLSLRLKMKGYEIEEAENGKLGMDACTSGKYDLVLMDMHMPVMDGYTAATNLRQQGYKGTIIAVTASAMIEETSKAIGAGCNFFISKPIGEDFEEKIQRVLDGGKP